MIDLEEFYILGEPIETEIGVCEFLKVKEYPDYFSDLQLFSWSKEEIVYHYHKINENNIMDELIEEIKQNSLFEIITSIPEFNTAYSKIFSKVFNDESILPKFNEDNFCYYRKLVMRMNGIKEEEINPNPEIQEWVEKSKRVKSQNQDEIHFSDIISSVVVYAGRSYEEVRNWSLLQLYHSFHRIGYFKNYDTSTLFSTVSSDKIDIKSWGTHIDLFENEKHVITRDELAKKKKVFDE